MRNEENIANHSPVRFRLRYELKAQDTLSDRSENGVVAMTLWNIHLQRDLRVAVLVNSCEL